MGLLNLLTKFFLEAVKFERIGNVSCKGPEIRIRHDNLSLPTNQLTPKWMEFRSFPRVFSSNFQPMIFLWHSCQLSLSLGAQKGMKKIVCVSHVRSSSQNHFHVVCLYFFFAFVFGHFNERNRLQKWINWWIFLNIFWRFSLPLSVWDLSQRSFFISGWPGEDRFLLAS